MRKGGHVVGVPSKYSYFVLNPFTVSSVAMMVFVSLRRVFRGVRSC
jgi:hypothetical protein